MTTKPVSGPRCAALVGTYTSGKTTLMEALLHHAGAIGRKGTVREGNTVGDSSVEARERQMSVELNVAHCDYLGESWTLLDCPGSIELAHRELTRAQDIVTELMLSLDHDQGGEICFSDPQ